MSVPDIQVLIDSKPLISALSIVGGALLGNFVAVYRNRLKTLEYTVSHDRVGLSADDAVFGSVRVTWQNQEVTNLYSSTVVLENLTTRDYSGLKFKVYTGDTLLLTERTEIAGTTFGLSWTDEYIQSIRVVSGVEATEQQIWIFRHNREYVIPVFNRRQRVVIRFLTTVPNGNQGPSVWLDMLYPGVRVQFRLLEQQIHGVPIRVATPLGLITCLVVLVISSLFISEPWAAALVCMIFGLVVQSIGAIVYRGLRVLKHLVLR